MMQFGPGTPYPTAMQAVAASMAHRNRWVAAYPSMQQNDDARLIQSISDILAQVYGEALVVALRDPAFSERVAA